MNKFVKQSGFALAETMVSVAVFATSLYVASTVYRDNQMVRARISARLSVTELEGVFRAAVRNNLQDTLDANRTLIALGLTESPVFAGATTDFGEMVELKAGETSSALGSGEAVRYRLFSGLVTFNGGYTLSHIEHDKVQVARSAHEAPLLATLKNDIAPTKRLALDTGYTRCYTKYESTVGTVRFVRNLGCYLAAH